jgi:hypothetical protein
MAPALAAARAGVVSLAGTQKKSLHGTGWRFHCRESLGVTARERGDAMVARQRSMKMGNASPPRYDAEFRCTLRSSSQRKRGISRYAPPE